jgi:hypothetical protein
MTAQWIKVKNLFSKDGVVNELQSRILNNQIDGETLRWFSTGQLEELYKKMKTMPSQPSEDVCKVFDKALHIAASSSHSREKQAALLSLYSTVPEDIRNRVNQSFATQFSQVLGGPAIERFPAQSIPVAPVGPPPAAPSGPFKAKRLATEADKKATAAAAPKGQETVILGEVVLTGASPKERYSELTTKYTAQLLNATDNQDKVKCREYLAKVFDMKIDDSHFTQQNRTQWQESVLGSRPDPAKVAQFRKVYTTAKG